MPIYEYKCTGGHEFEEYHRMDDRHNVVCPKCKCPVRIRASLSNFRFAEPLTVLQDLGGNRGYKQIGWIPDSGIHHKPGEAVKTAKDVEREEYGGLKEV